MLWVEFRCFDDDAFERRLGEKVGKPFRVEARARRFSRNAEIEDHAQSIHVASFVGLAESELLGRGVGSRSEMRRVLGCVLVPASGYAEIDDGLLDVLVVKGDSQGRVE